MVELPLSSVKDCYNLRLTGSPIMLTRQALHEDLFEILWPGYRKFVTEASFSHQQGDKLYFVIGKKSTTTVNLFQ